MTRQALMLLDNEYAPDPRVRREAAALREAGWSVRIAAWDREGGRPHHEVDRNGVEVFRLETLSRRQLGLRQLLHLSRFHLRFLARARTLCRPRPDVIHAHDLLMLPLSAALKASFAGRPRLVYDAHELYSVMEVHRYPPAVLAAAERTERLLARRAADAVITVSEQRARDWFRPRVGPTPVHVCGNWYDPVTPDAATRREARERLGVPAGDFCVVYAGGLGENRRVDLLADAARELRGITVVVAGRGPREEALRAAASKQSNLRFVGWSEDPDALYDAADAIYYVVDPLHPYAAWNAPNNAHVAVARGLWLLTGPGGEAEDLARETEVGVVLERLSVGEVRRCLEQMRDSGALPGERHRELSERYRWSEARRALLDAYEGRAP